MIGLLRCLHTEIVVTEPKEPGVCKKDSHGSLSSVEKGRAKRPDVGIRGVIFRGSVHGASLSLFEQASNGLLVLSLGGLMILISQEE